MQIRPSSAILWTATLVAWGVGVGVGVGVSEAAVLKMEVQELAVMADRIVIGDVVSVASFVDEATGLIKSRVVVDVIDQLKGQGDQKLKLQILGGTVDDLTLYTSVTPIFLEGDHVLLFVDGPGNHLTGEFQGAYLTDGALATQMQGGTQRFIDGDVGPLADLIGTIRRALPPGTVPDEITPYTGRFTFQGGAIPFVTLGCDWSTEVNPMEEGYRINGNCTGPGCGSSQLAIEAMNRGADVWNNAGADFYFNYLDTSTAQTVAMDAVHLIYFEQANVLQPQTVAATFFWCSGTTMLHWDMAFNDFHFNFWDGVTGACSSLFDIQAVAAHELGHTLGLGHSPVNGATMFASVGACNLAPRTLHSDDIAGIEFIYGSGLTSLPFFDSFPSTAFDGSKWIGIDGAASNARGINEPSAPNSANVKGQVDGGGQLLSAFMDLSAISGTTLSYSYQRTGNVDPPEPGDDLLVEYASTSGFWVELNRHLGDGPDMTTYEFVSLDLPAGALHDNFRFRFRVLSSQQGLDNWFVDDVGVDAPPPCPADLDGDGSVAVPDLLLLLALWGLNPGGPPDFDGDGAVAVPDLLLLLAAWGPCP